MSKEKNAPGGSGRERESVISRCGNTEVIQTKDKVLGVNLQEQYRCRQGSLSADDLSRQRSDSLLALFQEQDQ